MNIRKNLILITVLVCSAYLKSFGFSPNSAIGDSIRCLLELELEQMENGDFVVSMISDTTWDFPDNVVSTAQFTLKVPTNQLVIGEVNNLIDGVIFFVTDTIKRPIEAPNFDYISFALGSQGTASIPFQKGEKVNLFSFTNTLSCTSGAITLMDNATDPFFPPNELDANVGQQLTAAGFRLADVPIGIRGDGVTCGDTPIVMPPDTTASTFDTTDLGAQIVKQDITCFGANDGLIVAKGNGGTSPYTYSWGNGATTSTIENLVAGVYGLTLTDANNEMYSTLVTIEEPAQFFLGIDKTDATQMMDNGTATPIFSGGTPPYQFSWSNGSIEEAQTGLAAGIYTLTITDANGCEVAQTITINSADCPEINLTLDMKSPNCPGDSTGALRVLPMNGEAPFTFLWQTGDTTATLNNLVTGTYMVTVMDANGCSMSMSALLPDANPIVITLTASVGDGVGEGSISSIVSGGNMPYTYAWSNGSNETSLSGLSSGVYELSITDNSGCMQTASVVLDPQSCPLGILDTFGRTITLDSMICFTQGEICLPIPLDSMVNYSLFLNGASYMESIIGCRFDTFFAYTYFTLPGRGDFGPYILDEWPVNGQNFSGQFQNILSLVDSMNNWDPVGNWRLDTSILIIEGGLPANQYGEMRIRTPLTNSETTLDLNTNLTPTGTLVSFESGMHELVLVEKQSTCSDTLTIIQPCTDETDRDTTIIIDLMVGAFDTLDLSNIFGAGVTVSANQCPEMMDGNATIGLNNGNQTVAVEGLIEGIDQACFIIMQADNMDEDGAVINLTIQVNVIPADPEEMDCPSFLDTDTFAIQVAGCENFEICVPLFYDSLLTYGVTDNGAVFTGIVAACDNGNGTTLNFSTAKTHELIFTNSEACKDTVIVAIHAPECDEDLVIRDTVEIAEDGRSCIEFAGLPTPYQSVNDLCPEKNGEMAMLTIDGLTGCIDYTGVELGVDTACIEVCDVFGFCDTVTLVIFVTSGDLINPEIDAVDDSTTTGINEPIVFNALGNDIFSILDDMYLVGSPDNGIATFNLDGTIRYVPVTDYCNDTIPDMFQYAICSEGICDTATVTVLISCVSNREFTIYNALSPNGDGINDVFQIDGIEDYPNNSVQIFNRWGNQVYEMTGYKNEWNGNWGNQGELLPDGTYFYLFSTGEGDMLSGWLEIRR